MQSASLMQRLRDETAEHHKRAESRPLEQSLARGQISRKAYAEYLGQRLRIHEVLESEAFSAAERDSRLRGLIEPNLLQANNLRSDLRFFGVDPSGVRALSAANDLIDEIRRLSATQAAAVFGVYYVFEGSKNGARFIARALMKTLGLTSGPGLQYLDPHGEAQRALWIGFKERMDRIDFSPEESDAIVAAAGFTFDRVADLDDQLYQCDRGGASTCSVSAEV